MKKKIKITLLIILAIIVLSVGGFLIYASDYYHAKDIAIEAISVDDDISYYKDRVVMKPSEPTDTGIIFYPGAKVEFTSYIPIFQQLKQQNYTCILLKMPLNFAFLNKNAADGVFSDFSEIKHWYIVGHSLGGAMASAYTSDNLDKIDGLILLGAYVYGDVPKDKSLTIYGTEDLGLDTTKVDETGNVLVIEGGNHSQFGNYGKQKGDGEAKISWEEQQEITVNAIIDFIENK